tara:strand:+ start:955 stop:1884 length:930 start_codon:yes stop_codon:yes gene_type:complete
MNNHVKLFCEWQKAVTENDFLFSGGIVAEFSPTRGKHCQLQVHGNAIVLREQDAGCNDAEYCVIGGYSSEAKCFWVHDTGWEHPQTGFADRDAFNNELPFLFARRGEFTPAVHKRMLTYARHHAPAGNSNPATHWDNEEMRREHVEDALPVFTSGANRLTKDCRMGLLSEVDGNLSLTEIQQRSFVWRLEECFNYFSETDESENVFRYGGEAVIKEIAKHGPGWFENDGSVSFEYWKNTLPPVVLELRKDGTEPEGYIAPDGRIVTIGIGRMFLPEISRFLTDGGPFGNPPDWAELVQAFAITNAFRSY